MSEHDNARALLDARGALDRAARDSGLTGVRPAKRKPWEHARPPEPVPREGMDDGVALFDPDGFVGADAATQALIDGERPTCPRKPRGTAAYYDVIGPAPDCVAGDVGRARVYLAGIAKALELGGWTHAEYVGLKTLEKTWRARATGRDARFMVVGNYHGRLPRDIERRVWLAKMAQRGVL